MELWVSLCSAEDGTRWPLEVRSNSNGSMVVAIALALALLFQSMDKIFNPLTPVCCNLG